MRLLVAFCAIIITSCGPPVILPPNPEVGTNENQTKDESTITENKPLDGYYEMPNNGFIELITINDGRVLIYGAQVLKSSNFDKGFALHPKIPQGPHTLTPKGTISGSHNPNYSPTVNDLEEDGSTVDISGRHRTEYRIKLNENDQLEVDLTILDGTNIIDPIIARRVLVSK